MRHIKKLILFTNSTGFKLILSIFALIGVFNHAVFDSSLKIIAAQEVIIIPYIVTYFSAKYSSRKCRINVYRLLDYLASLFTWILIIMSVSPLSGIIQFSKGKIFLSLYKLNPSLPVMAWLILEIIAISITSWYSSNVEVNIERRATNE